MTATPRPGLPAPALPSRIWSPDDILALLAAGLRAADAAASRAQDVRGLDALREVDLHPLLASALRAGGLGVLREHPYPGAVSRRAKKPDRARCDLVLTPAPRLRVRDPVADLVEHDLAASTLFAHATLPSPRDTIPPDEAYWLEVKCVGQYTYTEGVPGENRAYASELVRGLRADAGKLAEEAFVRHGGVLLVHFTRDDAVAEHDLGEAMHRLIDAGLPVRAPRRAGFPIADRIGNAACSAAIIEVAAAR